MKEHVIEFDLHFPEQNTRLNASVQEYGSLHNHIKEYYKACQELQMELHRERGKTCRSYRQCPMHYVAYELNLSTVLFLLYNKSIISQRKIDTLMSYSQEMGIACPAWLLIVKTTGQLLMRTDDY